MPKMKSHSASDKRFDVTKNGKVKINHSHHRHNLGIKTQKRKRALRSGAYLSTSFEATIRSMIQK
jgi:large subunit ribosomal protein L35